MKNKIRNLCPSQDFIPHVARGFVYFLFMFIKFLHRNIICTGPFISPDGEVE